MNIWTIVSLLFIGIIIIMSIVLHEWGHAKMADWLGDSTPRKMHRLTLNPIKHLTLVGSLIVPLICLILSGGKFAVGWAKPVIINFDNLRSRRWGATLISLAGPLMNFLVAILFVLIIHFIQFLGFLTLGVLAIFQTIIFLNIFLGLLNLLPIPPLDGSKVLWFIPGLKKFQIKYSILWLLVLFAFLIFGGLRWAYSLVVLIFNLVLKLTNTG